MSKIWNMDKLRMSLSVSEYLSEINNKKIGFLYYLTDTYEKSIGMTRVAQCPICGKETSFRIDLYSIREWRTDKCAGNVRHFLGLNFAASSFPLFGKNYQTCEHLFIVDRFISFNGRIPRIIPEELVCSQPYGPEQPYVMGELLDRYASFYCVMHSLPICRIENEQFVPTYSAFFMTYYSAVEDKSTIKMKIAEKYGEDFYGDYLLIPYQSSKDSSYEDWWNLKKYAATKKLLWLQPDTDALSLCSIESCDFPFIDITGRRYPINLTIPPLMRR